jgi:hypothetical protein
MADLDAVWAITLGRPYCEAIELILIIFPLPFLSSLWLLPGYGKY